MRRRVALLKQCPPQQRLPLSGAVMSQCGTMYCK